MAGIANGLHGECSCGKAKGARAGIRTTAHRVLCENLVTLSVSDGKFWQIFGLSSLTQILDQICRNPGPCLRAHTVQLYGGPRREGEAAQRQYSRSPVRGKHPSMAAPGDLLDPAVEALLRGNEVVDMARKKASKADLKKIKKAVAVKRKAGEECYTDEELEDAGFLAESDPYYLAETVKVVMKKLEQGEGLEEGALEPHRLKVQEAVNAMMKKIQSEPPLQGRRSRYL